ncbi:hypothetical protein PI124_g18968 [Phytophthora idaei]|nr:hypothetical protein PI125_g20516 [Phytophthora idaei]KAG3135350.1 hypothetical protein PI126_g18291 [Phytophthora idaei]KAG3236011.1 hypothetical protein PI124_g18968 [Phytophthora idaei]
MELSNAKVVLLPPSTTSKIQPLDAGIIASLKRRYRQRQLQQAHDVELRGLVHDI